jgi:hypothetical protein
VPRCRKGARVEDRRPRQGRGRAEIETSSFVEDFAVNSHGSLVWLIDVVDSNAAPTGQYELRAADRSAHREQIVDGGRIDKKSRSLSADGKTIRYPTGAGASALNGGLTRPRASG